MKLYTYLALLTAVSALPYGPGPNNGNAVAAQDECSDERAQPQQAQPSPAAQSPAAQSPAAQSPAAQAQPSQAAAIPAQQQSSSQPSNTAKQQSSWSGRHHGWQPAPAQSSAAAQSQPSQQASQQSSWSSQQSQPTQQESSQSESQPAQPSQQASSSGSQQSSGSSSSGSSSSGSSSSGSSSSSSSSSSSASASGVGSQSDIDAAMSDHNAARAKLGLPNLTWDADLAASAQTSAEKCAQADQMNHGFAPSGKGNNLFQGWKVNGDDYEHAAAMWIAEGPPAANPGYNHYSQVVASDTHSIGMGWAYTASGDKLYVSAVYDHSQ